MWDDAVITNVGKTLLAQWASGGTLNIDSAAAGTGTVNASLLMAQTGLVSQKQAMSIVKSEKITGGVRLQLQLTNKGISAQYTINQIGVWGSLDGGGTTMMAIFQDDDGVVVPAETDTPEYVFTIYAVLQMDNTGTITVTIDSSVNVSQEQFNELEQKVEDLDATDISLSVDGVTGETVAAGIEELAEKVGKIEGGVVTSVNGQTGAVTVTPAGIGAATDDALQDVIEGTTVVAKATHATSADSATNATNAQNAAYADSASEASQANYALTAKADAQGNDISSTYAKKSELPPEVTIDLNGSPTTFPSFYAPTTAGTTGQVLKSMGAGQAPVWVDEPKDIANASVTLGASLTFNGAAQEQTITSVVLDGTTLNEGTDYDVSGNVATDAGNYTLIVSGKGDYSGTLWVDWSIAKAQGSISVSETSVNIIGLPGTTKQVTVVIGNGYGDMLATSSAPSVVTAGISGNVINLTLVSGGNATITINMVGNYQASATISVSTFAVSSVLAENSAATIRAVADNDLGANYWAVGDTYPVPLNGTVGTVQYDNLTVWAYILGFNHNPDREGEHLIHFGCFKTAQTDGVDICLVDSHYGSDSMSGEKWFSMNHWGSYTAGGWSRCDMRYDILGSTNVAPDGYGTSPTTGEKGHDPTSTCATTPVENTLMAAFPADLRAVMRPATKYTDNTGGGSNNASYVTATQDYMPLLAEFEVQGERKYANSAEQNYQEQYAYYANGNSKVKYRQTSTGRAANWWCRSPVAVGGRGVCSVNTDGGASTGSGNASHGVAPVFFI